YTDKALIPVTGLGPLAQTWNFGSSVLGSSVSNESRTTFTEDTWLLKAAMKIATIPPLSWIFKDTSQTQSFMRGLFGAYWSDEDHAEQCPWYNDPNITESDVDGTIIERCHQGYVGTLSTGNGLPSRLGVLSSAIGSSN
ncbi:MAG: hypothetical protein Q3961_02795, partial [Bifidobacteriaceae bacterium]|nr:hypothetical protein [Bifidobacteriaceae bacterium]